MTQVAGAVRRDSTSMNPEVYRPLRRGPTTEYAGIRKAHGAVVRRPRNLASPAEDTAYRAGFDAEFGFCATFQLWHAACTSRIRHRREVRHGGEAHAGRPAVGAEPL